MLGAAKDAKNPSDDDDDAPPSPHPQHSPHSSATSPPSTHSSPSQPAASSAALSTPPPSASSSSSGSMSFFKRSARTSESSSVGRSAPPPISTSFAAVRERGEGKAQPPTLKLPMAAIVARPAFASSFRSFLVSKYCQENIDFLLAVERWTKTYAEAHPNWRRAHADDDGDRAVYAASVREVASVDLAHDKSGYVSLDLEHEPSSPLPPPSPAPMHTNLPRTALEIFHTYILLTGAQTVNIPAHTRLHIEHTVAALQASAAPSTATAERTPLSALLTPALFDDAVYEIQCLLEREWLTKYYATPQYATLVQLMDKRERHALLKEEAARAKAKLHQQLKRVAATVQGPPGGSPSLSKARDELSVHVHVEKEGSECGISAGLSPLSPPSPVSSLRPSEVRQAGRLGEPRRRKEAEEEKTQPDSAASSLEWSRDLDSPSPLDGRAESASSRSSVSLLTPPSANRGMFHPVATPHMHLSPRKAVARKVVVHADDDANASASYASLPSSASASALSLNDTASSLGSTLSSLPSPPLPAAHSPAAAPTTEGSSEHVQRRSFLVTPIPYPHDSDDEERMRAPFASWSSADDDAEDAPAVFVTHHDNGKEELAVQDDERLRKRSDSSQPEEAHAERGSPEPSTASLSPSPVMHAWPESSRSGGVRKEEGSGSEAEVDDAEDNLPLPEDGSGRFFSVMVADDDSDTEHH